MKSLENQLGSSLKGTGFSLKGTGFSLKGTGFSPYIQSLENRRGFSPEGHFPPPQIGRYLLQQPASPPLPEASKSPVEIRKPDRLNALTGLRSFAAVNIVLFHLFNPP